MGENALTRNLVVSALHLSRKTILTVGGTEYYSAMTQGLPRAEETKEAKTRSYPFKA